MHTHENDWASAFNVSWPYRFTSWDTKMRKHSFNSPWWRRPCFLCKIVCRKQSVCTTTARNATHDVWLFVAHSLGILLNCYVWIMQVARTCVGVKKCFILKHCRFITVQCVLHVFLMIWTWALCELYFMSVNEVARDIRTMDYVPYWGCISLACCATCVITTARHKVVFIIIIIWTPRFCMFQDGKL